MSSALAWSASRTYRHDAFPVERIVADRDATISICLPAREEAATLKPILEALLDLLERGAVDQVAVVDADSDDGTAELAAGLGAEVFQEAELLPEFGPVLGKGDAMWRALSVLRGEVVCYLDADSGDFGPHFACGVAGPIVCERGVDLVKGAYRRPFTARGVSLPDGGGRVTELTARPLLNLFYPDLAGFRQPLAGEMAARRALLERLPFASGYAVEIGLLIDAYREVGLDALAQTDLEIRRNRHQSLADLGPMAYAVLIALTTRLEREGRLVDGPALPVFLRPGGEGLERVDVHVVERPPMASVRAAA